MEREGDRDRCGREVDKENVQRKGHMDRELTEVDKGYSDRGCSREARGSGSG